MPSCLECISSVYTPSEFPPFITKEDFLFLFEALYPVNSNAKVLMDLFHQSPCLFFPTFPLHLFFLFFLSLSSIVFPLIPFLSLFSSLLGLFLKFIYIFVLYRVKSLQPGIRKMPLCDPIFHLTSTFLVPNSLMNFLLFTISTSW